MKPIRLPSFQQPFIHFVVQLTFWGPKQLRSQIGMALSCRGFHGRLLSRDSCSYPVAAKQTVAAKPSKGPELHLSYQSLVLRLSILSSPFQAGFGTRSLILLKTGQTKHFQTVKKTLDQFLSCRFQSQV